MGREANDERYASSNHGRRPASTLTDKPSKSWTARLPVCLTTIDRYGTLQGTSQGNVKGIGDDGHRNSRAYLPVDFTWDICCAERTTRGFYSTMPGKPTSELPTAFGDSIGTGPVRGGSDRVRTAAPAPFIKRHRAACNSSRRRLAFKPGRFAGRGGS